MHANSVCRPELSAPKISNRLAKQPYCDRSRPTKGVDGVDVLCLTNRLIFTISSSVRFCKIGSNIVEPRDDFFLAIPMNIYIPSIASSNGYGFVSFCIRTQRVSDGVRSMSGWWWLWICALRWRSVNLWTVTIDWIESAWRWYKFEIRYFGVYRSQQGMCFFLDSRSINIAHGVADCVYTKHLGVS